MIMTHVDLIEKLLKYEQILQQDAERPEGANMQ